jgi:uncharacterized protein (TIRG00374 family)
MITDKDLGEPRETGPAHQTATSPEPARRLTRKRTVSIGLSLALLAAIVYFVLPSLPDFTTVWGHVTAMTPLELGILGLVAAWNLATYWLVMVAATPGLRYRQAMVATQSSTAVANTLPGGSAISVGLTYAMMGSWGFSKSRTTVSLVVAGIWNNFVKLGMPVLALALLAFSGQASGSRVVAGSVGVAALLASIGIFAFILHSEDFAARAGERAGRMAGPIRSVLRKGPAEGWEVATLRFRNRIIGIVRHAWIRLTVTSLVGHFSLFLVLMVTLRDIGVSQAEVSWIQALAVFAFVRLLTAIPIMPGGLGIVELGLIGGLTTAGGDRAEVVAAVLVYRTLTYIVPIAFGIVTYLFWKRNTSWLDTAPPLDPALASPAPATVG